ncbi:hypothetical protein ACFYT4_14665 [Streptomyces sp. NPDC004609]|uniref:hypothetical protein n=1 Tax=Streptomyces sp. NPDC004609 TaxID=3364704 RepID=UPI0036854656
MSGEAEGASSFGAGGGIPEPVWGRPAYGREPAAAAVLAWLADADAPRLCVVTGRAGSGKSGLLAWLAVHGSRPGTPPHRRVHAVVPLRGMGIRGAVWELAGQLEMAARAPGELVEALAADGRATVIVLPDLDESADPVALTGLVEALLPLRHVRLLVEAAHAGPACTRLRAHAPAVMDLDHDQWTDPRRLLAWRTGNTAAPAPPRTKAAVPPDPDDPAQVIGADPLVVTRHYETSRADHGGLRAAWLRAGPSLGNEPDPAARALVLQAALGDGAAPRLAGELGALAAGASWRLVWSRVSGDVSPPWPGPALALAAGYGALSGQLLTADAHGTVRSVDPADATPLGRLPEPVPGTGSLGILDDGTVLALNDQGRLETQRSPSAPVTSSLAGLLGGDRGPLAEFVDSVRDRLSHRPARVLTASPGLIAAGDAAGAVRCFAPDTDAAGPRTAHLHRGPVTAVSAVDLGDGTGAGPMPLVYSGGADGRVRIWSPGRDPLATPVAHRRVPVAALAAAPTGDDGSGPALAIAWADGLVELRTPGSGGIRSFRPGPPVRAVALTPEGLVIAGMDEMTVCLQPC